jgi:transcriptional regulator with XRE-family HTH domain
MSEADPVDRLWEWLKGERTQADLARVTGASPQSVWRWLHRKTTPNSVAMRRIEATLGIPCSSWPIDGAVEGPPEAEPTATPPEEPAS